MKPGERHVHTSTHMRKTSLFFLLGSEYGGLYSVARGISRLGLNAGSPLPGLANRFATRHQPDHAELWLWQALRRFFEDIGLPPVAEPPPGILSGDDRAYYARNFARCMGKSLAGGVFCYADHLAALALPLLFRAADMLGANWKAWFFFSSPAREISFLKNEKGAPPPLTEFVWRNTAAAAAVHKRISFVDLDNFDREKWEKLLREISPDIGDCGEPPECGTECETDGVKLSSLTANLYRELVRSASAGVSTEKLRHEASCARAAQAEQNGWQYLDYLDCGELDARARRLLSHPETDRACHAQERGTDIISDDMEREQMRLRHDFATQLFLHNQSLRRHYLNCLEDERQIHEREIAALREKYARLGLRHKNRLRILFDKVSSR